MNADERYFYERAVRELELAQRSDDPNAVAAHYELAERYLDRIHPRNPEQREEGGG